MPDLFISYSRKDSEQALQLAERLRSSGVDVWIDQHGIEAATSWSKEIVKAIDTARAFIVLISSHSMESENVTKEVSIACEAKKRILPIAIEDIRLNDDLRYHLAGIQRVAYTEFDAITQALASFGIVGRGEAKETRKSLMVLPFEDLSPTQDNGWFTDGMASELVSTLSSIKSLRVVDWNTSKLFKERKVTTRDLARELDVRYFIEGSVRKFGDQIKIAISLLDIDTADHLWQDAMKGTMEDVFDIQERVAQKVLEGLRIHLGQSEENRLLARGTENVEAYELSLKSMEYFNRHTRAGLTLALEQLERAIALDPNYAVALRQRAYVLVAMHDLYSPDPALLEEAETLAARALEVDPGQVLAAHVLALAHLGRGEISEAERVATESIEHDPDDSTTHFSLGFIYAQTNRPKLAIPLFERSLELDPDDTVKLWNMVHMSDLAGDTARVEHWSRIAVPVFERHLRLIPDNESMRGFYAHVLYFAGEIERSREVIRSLAGKSDLDSHTLYNLACLAARTDDSSLAIELLRRTVQAGYHNIEGIRSDPDFQSLRGQSEFDRILETAVVPAS
jgi:adenylate cyclase